MKLTTGELKQKLNQLPGDTETDIVSVSIEDGKLKLETEKPQPKKRVKKGNTDADRDSL